MISISRNNNRTSPERYLDVIYEINAKENLSFIGGDIDSDIRTINSKTKFFNSKCSFVDKAIFLPYLHNYHIPNDRFHEFLAYDENLVPLFNANQYKTVIKGYKDHPQIPLSINASPKIRHIGGLSYYMGLFNPHFGHALIEVLSRAWFFLKSKHLLCSDLKFVFHTFKTPSKAPSPDVFLGKIGEYLKLLNIRKDQIIFIDQPTEFENIIIPEIAISISDGDCFFDSRFLDVYSELNEKIIGFEKTSSKPVYISRAKWAKPVQGRGLLNEAEVEECFRKKGFEIIYPEVTETKRLHALLKTAPIVAGVPGSGLLNSIFSQNNSLNIAIVNKSMMIHNPGFNHFLHMNNMKQSSTVAYVHEGDDKMSFNVNIKNMSLCLKNVI